MKTQLKIGKLTTLTTIAIGLVGLSASSAHAWIMSGIDGSLTLAPEVQSIQLTDANGMAIVLGNDSQIRLRLSNKSSSMFIMKDENSGQTLKVHGGFPGGDLRNFVLTGQQIGQGVTLHGATHDVYQDLGSSTVNRSCTYTCRVVNPPARPIVRPRPVVPGANPPARPIVQTCSGSQLVEVNDHQTTRIFTVNFNDAVSGQNLGTFSGVVQRTSNSTTRVLEACR
jgi:hypothetical protein